MADHRSGARAGSGNASDPERARRADGGDGGGRARPRRVDGRSMAARRGPHADDRLASCPCPGRCGMTDRRRTDTDDLDEVPRMAVGRHRRPTTSETEPVETRRQGVSFRYPDAEARTRAKLMDPERAYADLIADLSYTYTRAGKPSLSALGEKVDYSKATLSKVFCGKAMPSWVLVLRLGRCFRVSPAVLQEWYILWTAANMHRRKPGTARGRASVPASGPDGLPPGTAGGADRG